MNAVTELLQSHRSIRKFTDEKLSAALIEEIMLSGQAAATSSNVQAVSVIQVNDPEARQQLAEYAGGQPYVASAGAFFVFCADLNRPAQACEMQGGDFASGMTEQFLIASIDVALFAQNCVVAAQSHGLGICYIGGLRNKPAEVSTLLKLPHNVYPVFGLCLGFPDQNPEVKPRMPLSSVLMQDQYKQDSHVDNINTYDETVREYYRTRTGGKKDSSWSEEMKKLIGKESRPHMREFLASKGFTLR